MSDWYALYTRPRHEKKVFQVLCHHEIETFLPTYKVRRRWNDRHQIVEEPLFQHYLFVNVDIERRYQDALTPYGALSFVTFGGRPAPIPEREIDSVRCLIASELP